MRDDMAARFEFEAPVVTDLGTLAELTQASNVGAQFDGVFAHTQVPRTS